MAKQISTARKVGRVVKSVLKVAVALVLVALLCVGNIVVPSVISGMEMPRMINNILGYEQSWDNSGVNDDGLDLEYYKADYTSETIKDAERALDEQIAAEGYVLLQNDAESLPLAEGTTLSFFGESVKTLSSSQNMVSMVTGTGADTSALVSAPVPVTMLTMFWLEESVLTDSPKKLSVVPSASGRLSASFWRST